MLAPVVLDLVSDRDEGSGDHSDRDSHDLESCQGLVEEKRVHKSLVDHHGAHECIDRATGAIPERHRASDIADDEEDGRD